MRIPRFIKRSGGTCFDLAAGLLAEGLLQYAHRSAQVE